MHYSEDVGFEPTIDFSIAIFKTVLLNHSNNLPKRWIEGSRTLRKIPDPQSDALPIKLLST